MSVAPAPDAAAPPGMCPGIAVKGGGGSGGGGDGDGNGGKDGSGGDGNGNGNGGSGNEQNGGKGCGDPVCPITGRVFVEIYDFGFAGPRALRWVREYSSQMSHVDGELGYGWTHAYGWRVRARRRTVEVLDNGNRQHIFTMARGVESATSPLGYRLTRRGSGFILRDRDGIERTFGPPMDNGVHPMTREMDRNGNIIEVQRDARGRLTGLVDSAGRQYRVQTSQAGKIERVDVSLSADASQWMTVVEYTYDGAGDLSSATDAEGFTGWYDYDHHLLVRHRSPSGPSYIYRYNGRDSSARCVESWGEDGAGNMPAGVLPDPSATGTAKGIYYQRFTYDPTSRYTEVDDGLGGVARFFGDDIGRVTKEVTPAGGVLTNHFRPDNGVIAGRSFEDGSDAVVKSSGGPPAGFEGSDGECVTTVRDEDGYDVSIYTNKKGDASYVRRKFDERGNLRAVVHHDGARESFDVDTRGLVTRWFDRRGGVTQYFHDAMGNCVAIVSPGNKTERMEYDYLGRRTRYVNAAGQETAWSYDRRSEVVEKRMGGGYTLRTRYNGIRKPIVIDECGKVTHLEWGGQGWLTKVTEPSGAVTEYHYDVQGNLRRITNALGQTYTAQMDHAGRMVGWKTFEGIEYGAGYDAANRLTFIRKPNGRALLEYDDDSRLAVMECADGAQLAFEYEGRGGPSKVTGAGVAAERYHDPFGRVHGEKLGRHALHVEWAGGEAIGLTSDVGLPVRYDFDTSGALERVHLGDKERVVDRPEGGDLLSSLGESLVLRRRLGPTGKLVYRGLASRSGGASNDTIALPGAPGTLSFVEYDYDPRGNLTRERRSDGSTIEYELSVDDRIVARRVSRGGKLEHEEKIGYDATGTPRMAGARYDAVGRPIELFGESMTYDEVGRLQTRVTDAGTWRYEWNDLDQLTRVEAPSHTVEMDYDARGRRVEKRLKKQGELCAKTSYVWNNNLVIHEVDELSGAVRTYDRVNGSWETFGHVDQKGGEAKAAYYLLAPNGAVDMAVGEDGAVVWDADNTVFGHRAVTRDDAGVTARFANQFYDPDVGLAYTWQRWYDARLGVFVTQDPLMIEGNLNPRIFADNPLSEGDPTGWHTIPVPTGTTPQTFLSSPGPHAGSPTGTPPGCIPCPSQMYVRGGRPNSTQQGQIDAAGAAYGCHSCGATSPGTSSGHWVGDHQPPLSTFGPGGAPAGAMQLYPHCINCSRMQGGLLSHHAQAVGTAAGTWSP